MDKHEPVVAKPQFKKLTVDDLKKIKGATAFGPGPISIKGEDSSGNKQEVG